MGFFKYIVEATEIFGVGGLIIMSIVALGVLLCYDFLKKYNTLIIEKMRKNKKRLDISDHAIFERMKISMEHQIPRMKIFCPLRKAIFTTILKNEYEITLKYLEKVVKVNLKDMTHEQFKHYWENLSVEISSVIERKCTEDGVPSIAFDRYVSLGKFGKDMMERAVMAVCDSEMVYDDNIEKTSAILDFIYAYKDVSLLSAEETINSLNGELSTVSFGGVVCTSCTESCPLRKE